VASSVNAARPRTVSVSPSVQAIDGSDQPAPSRCSPVIDRRTGDVGNAI
jgi:hypothetical protein